MRRSLIDNKGRTPVGPMEAQIAAGEKETVMEIIRGGRTAAKALEVAWSAVVWADHLVARFESEHLLPQPIACQAGCSFCCYHQLELTPPEALLIGQHVEQHFSPEEQTGLRARLDRSIRLKAGKSKREIAGIRRELPCPLLSDAQCSVYRVRPLMCRAMHALEAGECEKAWKSQDLTPVPHYAHRHEIILAISRGLLDGCRSMGCQAGAVDLAEAVKDFYQEPNPLERWIRGESVFRSLSPVSRKTTAGRR